METKYTDHLAKFSSDWAVAQLAKKNKRIWYLYYAGFAVAGMVTTGGLFLNPWVVLIGLVGAGVLGLSCRFSDLNEEWYEPVTSKGLCASLLTVTYASETAKQYCDSVVASGRQLYYLDFLHARSLLEIETRSISLAEMQAHEDRACKLLHGLNLENTI